MAVSETELTRLADDEISSSPIGIGPTDLCRRVARRLLFAGAVKNPLALPPQRYDELLPAWAQKKLALMCGPEAAPTELLAARAVLLDLPTIRLTDYCVAGGFVSTVEAFRRRALELVQEVVAWKGRTTPGFLKYIVSGDPGSGKSFFVKELAAPLVSPDDFISLSASDYESRHDLIRHTVERLDARSVGTSSHPIVFIDEVDTAFPDGYLFEHLYHLMEGSRPVDIAAGSSIERVCWFFAASCASSTQTLLSYARTLPVTTKIRDFLSRIPPANRLDLPDLGISPLEKVVRTASMIRKIVPSATHVEGLVLCLLGSRAFESTRELAQIVERSALRLPAGAVLFSWDSLALDNSEKIDFVASYSRVVNEVASRHYEIL